MTSRRVTKATKIRGFQLLVVPEDAHEYGLVLEETNGTTEKDALVVTRADVVQTRRVRSHVLEAVRDSGHTRAALGIQRRAPIPLVEEAGVRLALVLLATGPIVKARRIDHMANGVAAMAAEEAYYWYAKCMGADAPRIRRALRLFLAEE
jgi:hypothetical protein